MAMLFHKKGDYRQAAPNYLEQMKLQWHLIGKSAEYSSENEQNAYIQLFKPSMERFYTYALQQQEDSLNSAVYDNALFLNGFLLENSRLLSRALMEADTNTRQLYEKWQGCHRRLAKRYARPIADRKKIVEVEAEAEMYEKQLLRNLPAFQKTRMAPHWQQVRERLKPGESAIEMIHFQWHQPARTDSILYAALVIRPEYTAPKMIPLFEEKQLQHWLNDQIKASADDVNELYSLAGSGLHIAQPASPNLYELIWKPLEKALTGTHTVYLAPAGLLHRVNLGAIPFHPDSMMMDRFRLNILGSTRQLLSETNTAFVSKDAVMFGGIRFDMDTSAIYAALEQKMDEALPNRGLHYAGEETTEPGMEEWPFIKATEKEVRALEAILRSAGFSPEVRTGYEATEEAFKQLGARETSPRIIHLATHGFFSSDPKEDTGKSINEQDAGFKTSTNPLVRSGLLFAGANHAWKTGKPIKKGMENGILTAFEISHFNLIGTELVALSACETGLGDINGSEGVYGLQRAFRIAGVKYQIMSLWRVPDAQTKELMTTFYAKWLQENRTIPEAFRAAQQEMRDRYQDPYFWAGFVLME
jgi:CHAT domain-containing protein